jgi:hypothetical protein
VSAPCDAVDDGHAALDALLDRQCSVPLLVALQPAELAAVGDPAAVPDAVAAVSK